MAISTISVKSGMHEGFTTKIGCSHDFVIDQPDAAGGNDQGPNPLEVYLSPLGAWICAIGRIIANQEKFALSGIHVNIEGDIDKDFLLGKTEEGRSGFMDIRAFVSVKANMSDEEKEKFIQRIAFRCPVADNIKNITQLKPMLAHEVHV